MDKSFYYKCDREHEKQRKELAEALNVTEAELLRMLVRTSYQALH